MNWLNYHHLLYFYTVAHEGSVTAAAKKLHLSQPTLSGQVGQLEEALGEKLLERRGRGLVLTATGQVVYRYAEEIFGLGRDLMETMRGRPGSRAPQFSVGVVETVPKLLVCQLLAPVSKMPGGVRLVCREEPVDRLLAALAVRELDLVLSDAPLQAVTGVRAYSHLLGESGLSFFAAPARAESLKGGFPRSLDRQPMLMPADSGPLRRQLEHWLEKEQLRPEVVAEVSNSALRKALGRSGLGIFAAPTVIEGEVVRQYEVRCIGRVEEVKERFYALTVERRIRNPAVIAISAGAQSLFGGGH